MPSSFFFVLLKRRNSVQEDMCIMKDHVHFDLLESYLIILGGETEYNVATYFTCYIN